MVGKHIFVRCRNEQNNAGTWTAAMTDRIVDKDIVRNYIEPRCNMDETFAQDTLMSVSTNNVLRMYYINKNTLVVCRTYWVTDRITETQGRKGAYSISYILTGDDIARFCNDYSGAFDTGCFESYDSLISRINLDENNKITITEKDSIFDHKEVLLESEILKHCGFKKENFVKFMNALYDAVENGKQLAAILPETLREAWVKNGDQSAEKLGHFILSLVPDFMRINIGMVSHWSCQIKDRMVSDMPLMFVHPKNDEDIAYMKREGAHIVDLNNGNFTTDIPDIAPEYFSFIWDNIDNLDVVEDFWSYCKTNFRKLLKGRPTSAAAIESIYLIRDVIEESYSDLDKCRRAFLLAASQFAGAGTKVVLAESFLSEAITALGISENRLDKEFEEALCRLMSEDTEITKHQLQEYKILISAVERGEARAETVSALCAEVLKSDRGAHSYYISYIKEKQSLPIEAITLQLNQFISGLFSALYKSNGNTLGIELVGLVTKVIEAWTEKLIESVENWQDLVAPFAEVYAAYIKFDKANSEGLSAAYDILFKLSCKLDASSRESIRTILHKEEARIYRSNGAVLSDGSLRLTVFAEAFFKALPLMLESNKDTILSGYERLFRMLFNPLKEVSDRAINLYDDLTSGWILNQSSLYERIVPLILSCEEGALKEKPPVWNDKHTEKVLVQTEFINMKLYGTYYPSEERLHILLDHISSDNTDVHSLFVKYIERMPFDIRQSMYKALRDKGMLVKLFVYILVADDNNEVLHEVENTLGLSHFEKLDRILAIGIPANYSDTETASERFSLWYTSELESTLNSCTDSSSQKVILKQYEMIQNEQRLLRGNGAYNEKLKTVAISVFYSAIRKLFEAIPHRDIIDLPPETINNIMFILSRFDNKEQMRNSSVFEFVRNLDELIDSNNTEQLRAVCEKHMFDADICNIVKKRLYIHINANRCGSKFACDIYYTMLESNTPLSYPLERLLEKLSYDSLSHLDKGVLLIKIMLQLHNDRSSLERDAGRKIVAYLEMIAQENAPALLDVKFTSLWKQVRTFEYTRNVGFVRLMQKVERGRTVKFDGKMLLLSLIGLLVTSLFMGLMSVAVLSLGSVSGIIAIFVGVFAVLLVATCDVFLFVQFLSSKNRRRNR